MYVDCGFSSQYHMHYPYGDHVSLGSSIGYSAYPAVYLGYATYTDISMATWEDVNPFFVSELIGIAGQFPLSGNCSLFVSAGPSFQVSLVDGEDEWGNSEQEAVWQTGLGSVFGARLTYEEIGLVVGLKGNWYFVNEADEKDPDGNTFDLGGFVGFTIGLGEWDDFDASPYY